MSAKITSMPGTGTIHKDDKKSKESQVVIAHPVKEGEPGSSTPTESGIREIGREADLRAEREVREHLGDEVRRAQPEPEIGPDLEIHDVKSIEKEASDVISQGPSINLGITEEEMEQAQHAKMSAHVDDHKNVLGVASVLAVAIWVGRILKMAHGHVTRIVFKKEGKDGS